MPLFLKQFLRTYRRRRASRIDWGRRHAKVLGLHPELGEPRNEAAENAHLDLWQPLRKDMSLDTYRICANLSGVDDPRFVPEEVFVSEMQDFLYPDPNVRELADKNVYDRWFLGCRGDGVTGCGVKGVQRQSDRTGEEQISRIGRQHASPAETAGSRNIFPKTFLRKMDGDFCDDAYQPLAAKDLTGLLADLPYPVVCKPARDSFGGKDIFFCNDAEEVTSGLAASDNMIVQERIIPHQFFSRFGEVGLNTIRVYCYQSHITGEWTMLNATLRMGVDGSLDNETAGGIVCNLGTNGELNHYSLDKYAGTFYSHPNCNISFSGLKVPHIDEMNNLALELASQVPGTRLVGLDMCLDHAESWRCVEINLGMQTIRFAQYAGKPFFGDFTEQVITAVKAQKS